MVTRSLDCVFRLPLSFNRLQTCMRIFCVGIASEFSLSLRGFLFEKLVSIQCGRTDCRSNWPSKEYTMLPDQALFVDIIRVLWDGSDSHVASSLSLALPIPLYNQRSSLEPGNVLHSFILCHVLIPGHSRLIVEYKFLARGKDLARQSSQKLIRIYTPLEIGYVIYETAVRFYSTTVCIHIRP
jgi:hypothetical protein